MFLVTLCIFIKCVRSELKYNIDTIEITNQNERIDFYTSKFNFLIHSSLFHDLWELFDDGAILYLSNEGALETSGCLHFKENTIINCSAQNYGTMYIYNFHSLFESICCSRCELNLNPYQFANIEDGDSIITYCSINSNSDTDQIIKSSLYINNEQITIRYLNQSNSYNYRDTTLLSFSTLKAFFLSIINNTSIDKLKSHSILYLPQSTISYSNFISNSDINLFYLGGNCHLHNCCIMENECNYTFFTSNHYSKIYFKNCTIDSFTTNYLLDDYEISFTPLKSFINTIKFYSTAECNIHDINNNLEETVQKNNILELKLNHRKNLKKHKLFF